MGWFEEVKRTLREETGILSAALGLACALVSMGGMRLNTLDGIYPIESSLVIRHALGGVAALLVAFAYTRSKSQFVLSRSWGRVGLIAACFAVSLLFRYSQYLLTTTNPAIVLIGKLLEEFFGVLLILAWAERILPYGFKLTAVCFGMALAGFASLQMLLAFFQRVPSMSALAILPLISAILFKVHLNARQVPEGEVEALAAHAPERASWPVDLRRCSSALLYFGILFVFVFIEGQLLRPSLDLQQQNVSSQLAIALGNGLAGVVVLFLTNRLGHIKEQPRLAFSVYFLAMFALITISLALQGYLNSMSVSIYLVLSSLSIQLTTALLWASPFAALNNTWKPFMLIAFGYACNLFARTVSSANMLVGQINPGWPMGIVSVLMLGVVFVLCILFIAISPDGVRGVQTEQRESDIQDALMRTVAAMALEYGLTGQEARVLALCAQGMNARLISEEMVVSLNTSKSHMRMLYAKLGVHSQQELKDLVAQKSVVA